MRTRKEILEVTLDKQGLKNSTVTGMSTSKPACIPFPIDFQKQRSAKERRAISRVSHINIVFWREDIDPVTKLIKDQSIYYSVSIPWDKLPTVLAAIPN